MQIIEGLYRLIFGISIIVFVCYLIFGILTPYHPKSVIHLIMKTLQSFLIASLVARYCLQVSSEYKLFSSIYVFIIGGLILFTYLLGEMAVIRMQEDMKFLDLESEINDYYDFTAHTIIVILSIVVFIIFLSNTSIEINSLKDIFFVLIGIPGMNNILAYYGLIYLIYIAFIGITQGINLFIDNIISK